MSELWHGCAIILLYFAVCATSALVAHALFPIPSEVFRKLLHMILLGSLSVWTVVFSRWQTAAITAVAFALLVWPILALAERLKGYSALLTERKQGEIKSSLLLVFFMYAVVVCLCWGLFHDRLLALAGIYAWSFGDAAAALIGKRFGRHHFKGREPLCRKSWEGTGSMFAVSFVSVLAVLTARGGLSLPALIGISACTAAVSAVVELYSKNGMDTVTCPLAATAVLLPLTLCFGGGL